MKGFINLTTIWDIVENWHPRAVETRYNLNVTVCSTPTSVIFSLWWHCSWVLLSDVPEWIGYFLSIRMILLKVVEIEMRNTYLYMHKVVIDCYTNSTLFLHETYNIPCFQQLTLIWFHLHWLQNFLCHI